MSLRTFSSGCIYISKETNKKDFEEMISLWANLWIFHSLVPLSFLHGTDFCLE